MRKENNDIILDIYEYVVSGKELGRLVFSEDDKTLKVIGHFDGYICGMITALRYFEVVNFDYTNEYTDDIYTEETVCTTFKFKSKKRLNFYKDKIIFKLEEYLGIE